MKILLPPSEGKTPSPTGPTLDLDGLSAPELTTKRKRVLAALKKVSKRRDALEKLGVGASLAADVERNTVLDEIPCAPALLTYSGVLYEAMGAGELVAQSNDDEKLRTASTTSTYSPPCSAGCTDSMRSLLTDWR